MTTAENVDERETQPFALDFWSMNLGCKDTEKHVQDSELYFENFCL